MNFPIRNKPRPSVIESGKSVIVPVNTAIKPRQPVIEQAAGVFLFSRVYVQAPTDFAQPPQPVFPADVFSYRRRQAPPQHHAFPPFANCFSTRFSRFVENLVHRVYCLFSNASFMAVSAHSPAPAYCRAPLFPVRLFSVEKHPRFFRRILCTRARGAGHKITRSRQLLQRLSKAFHGFVVPVSGRAVWCVYSHPCFCPAVPIDIA